MSTANGPAMSLAEWEIVIGLEVHVQLKTRTKLFCGCANKYGAEPNTLVCPVCLGLPGVLPVLNREAFLLAVRAGVALGCDVAGTTKFDRKNYFYPDLPKGYQVSQFDRPVNVKGKLEVDSAAGKKNIGITRVHLEEDAGKLIHPENEGSAGISFVDLNRAGVPLVEIVSEPDMRTPDEAHSYLVALKEILQYVGISDCDMEKGSLRCDANVSIRRPGDPNLGTKTEIKNLNSFKAVAKALQFEAERHAAALEKGESIQQVTLTWDAAGEKTVMLRSKEGAHDYRYFPEPDLVQFHASAALVEEVRKALPERPAALRERYVSELGLPAYDAGVLTADKQLAELFDRLRAEGLAPKVASNWVMKQVLAVMNDRKLAATEFFGKTKRIASIAKKVEANEITGKTGLELFAWLLTSPETESVESRIKELGLTQLSDEGALESVARSVVDKNPKIVADIRGGKSSAIQALVGQMMRETRGQANASMSRDLLLKELKRTAPPPPPPPAPPPAASGSPDAYGQEPPTLILPAPGQAPPPPPPAAPPAPVVEAPVAPPPEAAPPAPPPPQPAPPPEFVLPPAEPVPPAPAPPTRWHEQVPPPPPKASVSKAPAVRETASPFEKEYAELSARVPIYAPGAAEKYRDLHERADEARDFKVAAKCGIDLGAALTATGDVDGAEEQFRRVAMMCAARSDDANLGTVRDRLGLLAQSRGDADAAIKLHLEAVGPLRRAGNPIPLSKCLNNLGMARLMREDLAEAKSCFQEARVLRAPTGDALGLAKLDSNLGIADLLTRSWTEAVMHLRSAMKGLEPLRAGGSRVASEMLAPVCMDLAICLEATGELEEAVGLSRRASQFYSELGDREGHADAGHNAGYASLRSGDYAGALESFKVAGEESASIGERKQAAESTFNIAIVQALMGELVSAKRTCLAARAEAAHLADEHGIAKVESFLVALADIAQPEIHDAMPGMAYGMRERRNFVQA